MLFMEPRSVGIPVPEPKTSKEAALWPWDAKPHYYAQTGAPWWVSQAFSATFTISHVFCSHELFLAITLCAAKISASGHASHLKDDRRNCIRKVSSWCNLLSACILPVPSKMLFLSVCARGLSCLSTA